MAFKILGDNRDEADIWVVDASERVLTSARRIDELQRAGYIFEAAVAQATVVEGLLLCYLLTAKQIDLIKFDNTTEKRLAEERITFGQVKDALKKAQAFHNAALAGDVESYVAERNQLAHHLAIGLKAYDLEQFYEKGRHIASLLWKWILTKTEDHRRRNL